MSNFRKGLFILAGVGVLIFIELFAQGKVIGEFSATISEGEVSHISYTSDRHRYSPATVYLPTGELVAVECSGTKQGDAVVIAIQKTPLLRRTVYRCLADEFFRNS
ncbi:MAG: hypothetical protein AAF431_12415 [Pseudomonadota bacterium]